MATTSEWIEGARPRTLPAAISPVVAGTGLAVFAESAVWWKALLALVVALSLQVAVNFANDYSDGVRGTDADRVGPLRLVGSGAASPGVVKLAAFSGFAVAGVAGLALALTTAWWLVLVGAVAMVAAWYYTGGSTPYGYNALGEVGVFVFFGLVAVGGTAYVQTEQVDPATGWVACGIGALACAILVANNLRDIRSDELSGKRTLAVVIGDAATRGLFAALHVIALGCVLLTGWQTSWWVLVALVSLPLSWRAQSVVRSGATGGALIPVLRLTGLTELVYALGLFAGLAIGAAT